MSSRFPLNGFLDVVNLLEYAEQQAGKAREAAIDAEVEALRTLLPHTPEERLRALVLAFEGYEVIEGSDAYTMQDKLDDLSTLHGWRAKGECSE